MTMATMMWAPGVGPGLYEYVGTGNTGLPSRIDLHNDGTPISDCSVGPFIENAAYFNHIQPTERPCGSQ